MKMRLTESNIAALEVPKGKKDITAWDPDLSGFGVRKYDTGRVVYVVKYEIHGQQRKITLGAVVRGNQQSQRKRAGEILAKARLGQDTSAERQAAKAKPIAALSELIPRYLKACEPKHRPRAFKEKTRHLARHMRSLHALAVEDVTRRLIVAQVDRIAESSGPVAADRSKASLSAFFAWCIEKDYLDSNPVANISRRDTNEGRDRVLNEAELIAVWNACGDSWEYGRVVRLLILTGQRCAEIGDLQWPEINFDKAQIELAPGRTKNKKPHIVPLSPQALAIIAATPKRGARDFVFGYGKGGYGGWSKSKAQLNGRLAGMAPWRLHDLRRTFVTMLSERGIAQPHIVEALVNHISGHKAGVAGVYNRAVYAAEKRQAMAMWGAHVEALISGKASNIISFDARA